MNKNHIDQTQFSLEKNILGKGKWVCYYYMYICYLLSRRQTNKQTDNILF